MPGFPRARSKETDVRECHGLITDEDADANTILAVLLQKTARSLSMLLELVR